MRRSRRLSVIGALAGALACGKRGDPLPPVRVVPQPVAEFQLAQRGSQVEITGLAPSVTATGTRLPVLDIEILRAVGPGDFERLAVKSIRKLAPGEVFLETEPLPAPGTLIRVAASAVVNGRASRRTNVLALTAWPPLAAPFGLTATLTAEGVALGWTPAPAQPAAPPAVPSGAPTQPGSAATPSPVGSAASPGPSVPRDAPPDASPSPGPSASPFPAPVPPAAPVAGAPEAASHASPAPGSPPSAASPVPTTVSPTSTPSPLPTPLPSGFWIYRRAKDGGYGRALRPELVAGATYLDASVQPGQEWCYSVRYAAQPSPPVESDASNEACVSVRDISAPVTPAGLALIRGPQGVEISWVPNTETDLAGYRVYRAVGPATAGEAVLLAEITKETTLFRDGDLTAGLVHAYFVVAVDAAGNESPRSEILQVRP